MSYTIGPKGARVSTVLVNNTWIISGNDKEHVRAPKSASNSGQSEQLKGHALFYIAMLIGLPMAKARASEKEEKIQGLPYVFLDPLVFTLYFTIPSKCPIHPVIMKSILTP